jgi:hypothetical protein
MKCEALTAVKIHTYLLVSETMWHGKWVPVLSSAYLKTTKRAQV